MNVIEIGFEEHRSNRAEGAKMNYKLPTIDMIATGKNIEKLRKATGITVRELQDIFCFSTPQAIYKWQRGAAIPSIDNLVVLSDVFQVSIDQILIVEGRKAIGAEKKSHVA